MYEIIKLSSYIIRQFVLPNPFTNFIKDPSQATIINWIVGGIFIPLSYVLTGTWYDKKTPVIGCIGFLANYALLTGLFLVITLIVKNLYVIAIAFFIFYFLLCYIESKLLGKKNIFI